ncbi:MAG TPA: nicotinate-nucleotide adenylyltransferase [Syntrophomonadaceae bacterium]|nr:nicotinate-nucleotide adenylyltransferase [Syntrophomonadaceae bacterium]
MREAIGILGGTFDPVHYGHLMAAEFACSEFKLTKVLLMLSARPPHKREESILDLKHRLRMLELAAKDNDCLQVSDLELNRPGHSFTVDTVRYLRKHWPDKEIYFIMGSDVLFTIDTWKDADELFRLCKFIVVTRPGYRLEKDHPQYSRLPAALWDNLFYLEIPGFDFSSTDIRKRVSQGKTIKYLLPPAVEQYIGDHDLYQKLGDENVDEK